MSVCATRGKLKGSVEDRHLQVPITKLYMDQCAVEAPLLPRQPRDDLVSIVSTAAQLRPCACA